MPRLSDLEAFEVSLVPRGANRRKFLLFKSDDGEENMDEILKSILESGIENEEEVDKKIDELLPEEVKKQQALADRTKSAIKGALRLLTSVKGELPNEGRRLMGMLAGAMGKGYAEPKKQEGNEPPVVPPKGPAKKSDEGTEGGMTPEVKEKLDTLFKQNEDLVKKNDDLVKKNEELGKRVGEEEGKRVLKEFEEKATSFGYVGDEAKKVAKALKEGKEKLSKEAYDELERVTKSNAVVKEDGNLFREFGSTQGGSQGGVAVKVEAKVAEIRKADPKLTPEQAETKVFENEPELYNEYLKENPRQGGY